MKYDWACCLSWSLVLAHRTASFQLLCEALCVIVSFVTNSLSIARDKESSKFLYNGKFEELF